MNWNFKSILFFAVKKSASLPYFSHKHLPLDNLQKRFFVFFIIHKKSSGLPEKNTLDIWFNYNCVCTKYCMICLTTEKVENGEGNLSNMFNDRNADKRKTMDFGGTILKNSDKHQRKISCLHSCYVIKANILETLIKFFSIIL